MPRLLPRSRRDQLYAEKAIGWTAKLDMNELSFTTATHFQILPEELPEDIDVRGLPQPCQPRPNHPMMRRSPPPYR